MLDSTARAERIDITSSEAAFYTWEVAQKSVMVRLPLALIDRLESEAVETFRSLTSRGSEIGGLLLGSTAPGTPALVTVADFELIPCDYSRGPLYRLSDIDLGRFAHAMEKHGSGAGARLVGYFRSHTRKGLSLDAEDLAFFEPRFLDPHQIMMLVRPFATKASSAGIFIRENGKLGETSHLEFPFRSSELTAPRNGNEKSEQAGPSSPAATAAGASPASLKQPSRAQIVPIASRREIPMPEPAAPPQSAAPVAAAPVDTPAATTQKTLAPPPPAEPEKPSRPASAPVEPEKSKATRASEAKAAARAAAAEAKAAAVPVARPAAPEVKSEPAPIVAAPSVEVETAPVIEIAPPATAKNRKLRLIVAAAAGMLVLVGGSLVVYPSLRNRIFPPAAVQQDNSPLSLRVERTAGGMLLSWDLHSPVILNAAKVMLSITDGERHENIQLDPNQVRTGSILYPPITMDVSFQMEVTDSKQVKTASESLRVLDPRPSPLAEPADAANGAAKQSATTAAAKPNTPAGVPETSSSNSSTPATSEVKTDDTPASHSAAPPLKHFDTESLAQRLRPVTQSDLPDAPTMAKSAGSNAAPSLPGIVTSQVPPPPRPSAPAPTPVAPATSAPSASGGQLRPAVVVTRVEPEYPRLARQAGASGMVELEAIIGVDGKVKNPKVLRGNQMLQKAAIDAVLQWKYIPAVLNGKAVESPVEIKLNFVQAHN